MEVLVWPVAQGHALKRCCQNRFRIPPAGQLRRLLFQEVRRQDPIRNHLRHPENPTPFRLRHATGLGLCWTENPRTCDWLRISMTNGGVLDKQFLDIALAERKAVVQPEGVLDDAQREGGVGRA